MHSKGLFFWIVLDNTPDITITIFNQKYKIIFFREFRG